MKPLSLVVVIAVLGLGFSAQPPVLVGQTSDLTAVLNRATEYVSRYEEKELGNLIVAETYSQTATIYNYEGRGFTNTVRRQMQSDFLLHAVGQERQGLRLVNMVDGARVEKQQKSFEALLGDPSVSAAEQLAAIKRESSRYNIGPVHRNLNVPTFALKVLRKEETARFTFDKKEDKKVSDVHTWEIKFQEQRGPTLSIGLNGEPLLSSGSLWIEPQSGRILKTEIRVENPYSDPKVKGTITVTYKEYKTKDKTVSILVPSKMEEQYTTNLALVTATATYSDYQLFKVDVQSSIDSKPLSPSEEKR